MGVCRTARRWVDGYVSRWVDEGLGRGGWVGWWVRDCAKVGG